MTNVNALLRRYQVSLLTLMGLLGPFSYSEALAERNPSAMSIALGGNHSAFLVDGKVFMTGVNWTGQLGVPEVRSTTIPLQVHGLLDGKQVVKIAVGSSHSMALTKNGEVYAWGRNNEGALGNGTWDDQYSPARVEGIPSEEVVIDIAAGEFHSLLATQSGRVYAFGSNHHGELGIPSVSRLNRATWVEALKDKKVVQVVAGRDTSFALTDDKELYTWGAGISAKRDSFTPTLAQTLAIETLSTGGSHCLAMTSSGPFSWGYKALGHEHTCCYSQNCAGPSCVIPKRIERTPGLFFKMLAAGSYHSVALTSEGKVCVWGDNYVGLLGLGEVDMVDNTVGGPTCMDNSEFGGEEVVRVFAGDRSSGAITKNGTFYVWGLNNHGQLGIKTPPWQFRLPVVEVRPRRLERLVEAPSPSMELDSDSFPIETTCYEPQNRSKL